MINADEHKKLLEQVTELERNSVNYFDVEKEFFLITSDNLSDVQTRLYGYSIQQSGIYEDDDLTPEAVAGFDGRGCYVYVEVKDGKITIKQDINGCWGIYLFRHGDYFALSNSFFRLLDYVKFRYPLTVNRDYCHYLMINSVAIQAYSQTAVNEIQFLPRNAIIHAEVLKKNLQIELIDYKEHTVPLDSKEGVAILDRWVEFWGDVLRNVAQHTKFISADLTGGFDTRIHFVPLLYSGIDLNKIRIYSATDGLHTHKEDYEIASQIANHYGFKLNQPLPARQFLNYSLSDSYNMDLYSQQTIRNLPTLFYGKRSVDKLYQLKGIEGETIRNTWYMTPKKFLERERQKTTRYSHALASELFLSIENILAAGFDFVRKKYHIENEDSEYIPQRLYRERFRNHHGKEIVGHYLRNAIDIFPMIDPNLYTLKLITPECPDSNLLMAIIFTRYAPDLLKFPFDSKHSIAPETIEYAKKINERFPRRVKNHISDVGGRYFHLQPRDLQAEKILSSGRQNPNIPADLSKACLKSVFESSRTFGLFTAYFDAELYHYAATYYDTHVFGRERPMYAVVGVTRVLEDVEISRRNRSPYRDMQRFLEQDFATIHKAPQAPQAPQISDKFKPYLTARTDIKRMSTEGDFQILSVSDEKATVWKPAWLQEGGIGYQIQSCIGKLEIVAKATMDGRINLKLRGLDIRDPEDRAKRIPYWIDYTKLTVNGKTIFDTLTPAWHNKPYIHNMDAKAGEEIKIQIEWLPHRSDT